MEYTHQQQARRVQKRRIQCNGETVCKTNGWLCWAGRRGLVWQWPSRQRRRARASLSPPVVRNEVRKPVNQSAEKRRAKRVTVRTNLWQSMSAPERERLYESVGKSLPVGRVGETHDVAQAYLFLMQEGFSTGQTVVVDGGTVLV